MLQLFSNRRNNQVRVLGYRWKDINSTKKLVARFCCVRKWWFRRMLSGKRVQQLQFVCSLPSQCYCAGHCVSTAGSASGQESGLVSFIFQAWRQ